MHLILFIKKKKMHVPSAPHIHVFYKCPYIILIILFVHDCAILCTHNYYFFKCRICFRTQIHFVSFISQSTQILLTVATADLEEGMSVEH